MNKKRICSIFLIMALIFGSFTTISLGSSNTKKMTAYKAIKKGNIVYCVATLGVYKVNIKTGKVKRNYYKIDPEDALNMPGPESIKIRKGYMYVYQQGPVGGFLTRVKLSNGKSKRLASKYGIYDYAISNGKIYFEGNYFSDDGDVSEVKKVMRLNGKSIKKTKYRAKTTVKKTNSKGYYVKSEYVGQKWWDYGDGEGEYWDYYTDYLVTKSGKKIKLCTYPGY